MEEKWIWGREKECVSRVTGEAEGGETAVGINCIREELKKKVVLPK